MASDGELRGVGGWLAFFLVTLGIISPGFIIISTIQTYSDRSMAALLPGDIYSTLITVDLVTSAVMLILCWFAVFRFLKVFNWTSVRIGIGTLWGLAVLNVFVMPMIVASVTGLSFGLILQAGGPQLFIRPLVYALIWTAYLLKSERVRNTYAAQSDGETAEVFA